MSATPVWRRYPRFWGSDPGADVDDEFAFHVETRVDELVAQGLSPKDARSEALRGFVAVENLFDADYDSGRTPLRTVGPPRRVRAGVRVAF